MVSDWGAASITGRWRHQWDGAGVCFLLVFLLGLVGSVAAAVYGLVPNGGLGVSNPVFIGLAGLAAGSNDDDISRLIEKIERIEAGEADVDFETDRDDDVGRLYEAVESLASTIQKRERKRKEHERRLEPIVENTTNPIFIKDRDGVYQFVNQAAADVVGLDAAEMVGKSDEELFDAESMARIREVDEQVLETGENVTEEAVNRVDGEPHIFVDNKYPYRDEDGEIIGLVGISQDVTERKEYERELRETKRHLELALEGTNTGIWEWDLATDELTWNETFERMMGLEPGAFEGTYEAFERRVHPEDVSKVEAALDQAVENDDLYQTEFRLQHEDGQWIWIGARGRLVFDEAGGERMVGINNDISERKRRERELREERDRFTALFENLPNPVAHGRHDEPIVEDVNQAFEETFGVEKAEIRGESVDDVIVPQDRREEAKRINRRIAEEGSLSTEVRRQTPAGLRDFKLDAVVRGEGGDQPRGYSIWTDITERKRRERELQETNERLNAIVEASPDALVALDLDGNVELWNPAAERIFGWSEDEVLGEPLPIVPEDRTDEFAELREAIRSGETFSGIETRRARKDGELIDVKLSAAPLRGSDDEVVGIMGVLDDISERKAAERRSHEREVQLERYKEYTEEVLDAIDDVFYIVDREGATQRWNQSLVEVTGYSDEEIASMNARDFVVEEDRELIGAAIDNIEELVDEPLEARFRTKGGESIPFEFVAAPLTDPDGTAVLAGIARDISERKEKERQLSRLIDNVPGYVYRSAATPPWEVEFVSEGVRDITGYGPEPLESGAVNWDEDVITERNDELEAQIGTALDQRESFHLTYPIETADGEFRWVKEQGRGVYAADGSVEAMEGVVIDDTERKRYEQELERTKDLLEQAGRIARIGGWELDLTNDPPEMTWTDQLYEIHGLSPGTDIDVETAVGLYHPEDREYIRNRFEAAIEHGESYDMEVRLHSEADQKRWVRAMGEAVYEDGKVVKLRGSIQDITRQKEREQELRATKDRLQKFIETSPVGVVAVDPDGTVTLWNDGMKQIFGWSEEEVLGEPYPAAPDDVDRGPRSLQEQVLEGEPLSQIEVQRETKDGTRIDISVSAGPVLDEEGEVTDVVAFIEDITERKERERELERTKELLAQAQHVARIGGWELDLTTDPSELTFTDELYEIHDLAPGSEVSLEEAFEFYHPEDRPRIRRAIEDAIEAGESYDVEARFHTANGEQLWVKAIGKPVQKNGETVKVRGSLQDVTRQKERELALQSLHDATRGLLQTESETEVAELVVETAASLFDVPGVGVYVIDDASNRLVPVAYTDAFETLSDGAPTVAVGDDGVVWNCFATGERVVFDDAEDARQSQAFGGDVDSGLLVPMGDHGVFVVATVGPRIDDETRRLAETLVATTEAAFDRLASEADLRKRDAELEAQNQRLRRQVQINDIIRRVDQSLIGATSREEVESAVCDRLVESEDVAFAWIGGFDDDDELVPRTWAGTGQTYLDALALDQSAGSGEPALATAGSGEPMVVSNVVDRLREDGWRRAALANGFHSVISVPLAVDDYTHGVLTVYAEEPGVFDELERAVFAELGQSIANAINAVSAREALHADTVVELTLQFDDPTGVLARVARDADCEVEYEGISTRSADETRLFFVTTGAAADDVESVLDDLYAVTAFRLVSESDDRSLFEATVTGPVLPSELVDQGASPRSIRATATGTEAVVDLPPSTNVREFVELLRESFPSVELGGRRNVERGMGTRQQLLSSLMDELTDRQLEVLRTAYFAGFFEWPRASTGEDVAEMLGVTQPTVNRHLRLGQQRLLAELFDEEAPELAA